VHGGDRPGIVSSVVGEVAKVGGNITDLSTRLVGDLYVLTAEVDLPPAVDAEALSASLHAVASELGVKAALSSLESDDL
jgi:glycine cleavage system transcriptional repressor